jgi:hypothetical protein
LRKAELWNTVYVEDTGSQKICGLMFEVAELWKRCQGDRTVENMWEAEELWNNI